MVCVTECQEIYYHICVHYKQEKNRKIENRCVTTEYTLGAFQSSKTSGLKFWQLLVANGTAFSKISKNEDNLAKYTQIFENFVRKFPFHSNSPAEFL